MATKNILEMSDDEVMNLSLSDIEVDEAEEVSEEEESGVTDSEDDASAVDADAATEVEESEEEVETDSSDTTEEITDESDDKSKEQPKDESGKTAADESNVPEPGSADSAAKAAEEAKEKAPVAVDFEKEYKKLLAPFKANGKEVKVESVDEAVTLMQMGANYSKKMTALKPNLRLLKMLENHDLLDETKLSHLIDISRKNPAAIAKAMKDAGIDPIDLDTAADYQPQSYSVSDQSLELDEVLADLRGTPSYTKTLEIVTSKWDAKSRELILNQPSVIRDIHQHVESGVYDKVMAEVDRQRMLGHLTNVTDVEAYKMTGEAMFNNPATQPKVEPVVVAKGTTTSLSKAPNPDIDKRKQAVAPVKTKANAAEPEFNPLAMSDAEFEAMAAKKKFY